MLTRWYEGNKQIRVDTAEIIFHGINSYSKLVRLYLTIEVLTGKRIYVVTMNHNHVSPWNHVRYLGSDFLQASLKFYELHEK